MWDQYTRKVRGPYRSHLDRFPGVRFCEHIPVTGINCRPAFDSASVNCSATTIHRSQCRPATPLAQHLPDDGNDGGGYPSMGSVAAAERTIRICHRLWLADSWAADVWGAGRLGRSIRVRAGESPGRQVPEGVHLRRLRNREALRQEFAATGAEDAAAPRAAWATLPAHLRNGVVGKNARSPRRRPRERRITRRVRARKHRRKGPAGTACPSEAAFVARAREWHMSHCFDHHGDNALWAGSKRDSRPCCRNDRVLYALVKDLEQRGRDSCADSDDGRVRSHAKDQRTGRRSSLAARDVDADGRRLRHGQGDQPHQSWRAVRSPSAPSDLKISRRPCIAISASISITGVARSRRTTPIQVVTAGGEPIAELF